MKPTYNPRRLAYKLDDKTLGRNRRKVVCLSVDEDEYLDSLATQAGMSPAEYFRCCAFSASLPSVVNVPELNREAWSSLGKLAANLFRCVKFIHRGKILDGKDLHPILTDILTLLASLRSELVGDK
jgi:hypothetical protein